jgi:hypothetical protein
MDTCPYFFLVVACYHCEKLLAQLDDCDHVAVAMRWLFSCNLLGFFDPVAKLSFLLLLLLFLPDATAADSLLWTCCLLLVLLLLLLMLDSTSVYLTMVLR